MKHGRTVVVLLVAAISAGLSGAAWGQTLAPVNPAAAKWQQDRAAEKERGSGTVPRAARPAAVRGESGGEDEDFGFVPELLDMGYLSELNDNLTQGVGDELPSRFDLREHGAVTPVRDQGTFGTCWAFAALGALESWIAKSEGLETDWSENHLANRHGWNPGFEAGGNAQMAEGYLLRWAGPVEEVADAYPNPGKSPEGAAAGRHVQRVRWIPGKTAALDHDGLKKAVMDHGALHVTYYHAAGYYNANTAAYCFLGGKRGENHAVDLVGWDDGYPRGNFRVPPPGDGAYLAKNSWGEDWGNGGYFWVSYYDETFARATAYAFENAEGTDNYDAVYQHDPLGMVGAMGYNGPTAWGANMFTAAEATKVAAAGFYAMAPRTAYELRVYTGCAEGAPRSGTLASEQSGTTDGAGYVTVPLATPAEVGAGERFSVVLKLTTRGYAYPLATEHAVPGFTSGAKAKAGESFMSADGTTWADFTRRLDSTANFCCKAYVKAGAEAERELAGLEISGVNSLKAGGTASFTCEAVYGDGTRAAVEAEWAIIEGEEFASVSADGTVTAKEVEADGTATVEARYSEGGKSAAARWKFRVTTGAPEAPRGLTATEGTETSCVRLAWEASAGASSYAVYRGTGSEAGNAGYLGTVTVTRYADATAVPGVDYKYFVKAKNDSGTSGFGDGAWGWRALSAPGNFTASAGQEESVELAWDASEGAAAYRVWRADDLAAEPEALGGWQEDRRFSDVTGEAGKTYWYYVEAAADAEGGRASVMGGPVEGRRTGALVLAALEIEGPTALVAGEAGTYQCAAVYTDGRKEEVTAAWSATAGTIEATGSECVLTAPTASENMVVTLRAAYGDGEEAVAAELSIAVSPTVPGAPEGLMVVSATADGVTLGWEAVAGASGYLVWRGASEEGLESIGSAEGTQHTDTTAAPGAMQWYSVSAANAAGSGPLAAAVRAVRPVGAPDGVAATYGTMREAVRVTWGGAPGATHYRALRAEGAGDEPQALCEWREGLAYNDAEAEPGVAYLYYVQAAADGVGTGAGAYGGPAEGMRAVTPVPVSLGIRGPAAVAAGESAVYAARIVWSDSSESTVAPIWSLEGADGAASVDVDGKLTVGELEKSVTATLRATYTEAGTTVSGSLTVQLRAPAEPMAEITAATGRTRWPWNGWVDIDYTLETAPEGTVAAITIAATDLDHRVALTPSTLEGDGADGGGVEAGEHRLSWKLEADYPGFHAKEFQISISATPVEPVEPAPEEPTYLVVDMSGGMSAATWPVEYLTAAPEGGFNTDEYKTTKLVLRRIPAGTFTMGSPESELGRNGNENQHEVTLTRAFYIGVFEVTQKQWELAMGSVPTSRRGDMRPVEWVSYNEIRGANLGGSWPASNDVDAGSFIAVVRAKTGLMLDLPTEAQWEYACRAGTTSALPNGKDLTSATGECPNLAEVARYGGNRNDGKGGYGEHTVVGSYQPNAWGLYDTVGNVSEWCVDWHQTTLEDATDPVGPATGTRHVTRGGGWNDYGLRSASRAGEEGLYSHNTPGFREYNTGLRLACSERAKRVQAIEFVPIGQQSLTNRVELSATATSGGTVTFAVESGPGELDGTVLTFTGIGMVVVSATQAGDDTWEAVTVRQSIAVLGEVGDMGYLVVDMSGGRSAESWPVTYLDGLPEGGFNTDEYKTTKMVLRRIPAGTFTMGSPESELGRNGNENQHEVTLTRAFYIGVFEVTQKQWELAMGSVPTSRRGDMRPVEWVSYNEIRGANLGGSWPASNDVDAGSFIGVVRAKTGLMLDLPTEAQWEYACRAGTTSALPNGKELTSKSGRCANLGEVARYGGNRNDGKGVYSEHTVVGSYQPNAWGLYDTVGNVSEWCVDWHQTTLEDATDPVGPATGTRHVTRGGGWNDYGLRSASRAGEEGLYSHNTPSFREYNTGLRLACLEGGKRVQTLRFAPIGPQSLTNCVELSATATSGGPVTFAVESGPGELNGTVLTFTGIGKVVVSATQAGDDTWEAVTVRQSVTVLDEVGDMGYLVVDMSGGASAESWPVTYLDGLPEEGFNTDEYKTTKMVLRKIPAGTFTMGSPESELGRNGNENQHEVTLTRSFYIGVFEVTQKQWELAIGSVPTSRRGDMRPVEWVSYNEIRGANLGGSWPDSNDVDAGSFIGVVRAKTGLMLDLPTEAQWEYACRAGTTSALPNGKDLTSATGECPNLAEVARYGGNLNDGKGGYSEHTVVGSYQPNAWGLYDTVGNVSEWCVDWHQTTLEDATDPVGPATGTRHVTRGGGWNDYGLRSASRAGEEGLYSHNTPTFREFNTGLRLACPSWE